MISSLFAENPISIHQKIQACAQSSVSLPRIHTIDAMTPGQFIRQGDVYCIQIEKAARGWKPSDSRNLNRHSSSSGHHQITGESVFLQLPDEDGASRGHPQRQALRRSLATAARLHPGLLAFLDLNNAEDESFSYSHGQLGPQVVAQSRFEITHPEHAHFSLPPGIYQIIYQLDFDRNDVVMD